MHDFRILPLHDFMARSGPNFALPSYLEIHLCVKLLFRTPSEFFVLAVSLPPLPFLIQFFSWLCERRNCDGCRQRNEWKGLQHWFVCLYGSVCFSSPLHDVSWIDWPIFVRLVIDVVHMKVTYTPVSFLSRHYQWFRNDGHAARPLSPFSICPCVL